MMRSALNHVEAHSETTAMVGDRMDTDVVSGLEAGLRDVPRPHGVDEPRADRPLSLQPGQVVDSVADLVSLVTPSG